MSDYKPTFRVSPKKRPWYKRLTPLAWTMIGVAVLVVILAGVAAAMAFGNRRASEEPWWTPTPTLPPSPTPIPPTPTPTLPASVWWADQMTEENGHLYPPPEVEDEVWEAFITGLGCWNIADRETPPEETLEALVSNAARHLANDPDLWRAACNGPTSEDEILELRPLIRLVEFGPRNPVICDEQPTQCKTAVAVHSKGVVFFAEEVCSERGNASAPCIVRDVVDHAPHQLYVGTLKYEAGSELWQIVRLEVTKLEH